MISFTITAKSNQNTITFTTHVLLGELGPANAKFATEEWLEDMTSDAISLGKCAFEDDHKRKPPANWSWQASRD
ncbi:hypothetical protein [Candidatus Phycosocius bacilliformis]|uniref:hypothetical protein n=1 Tax=Candidatus Phycosocius bacilliformis TaxID=1445552 RepID=UPI0010582CC2|nr:hypothetical protein [Candidatus Phycosocius bacilliformis]